jgi:uncharacterized membrane protein
MFDRLWFKNLAKDQIQPNLGVLALVILIYLGISFALGVVVGLGEIFGSIFDEIFDASGVGYAIMSFIGIIITYLVAGPLYVGLTKVYLSLTYSENPKASDVFYAFSSAKLFWGSVRLFLLMGIFIMLWTCLLIVPGILRSIDYMQAFYIFINNPEKSARECLKESIFLTRGHRGDVLLTQLSFILWALTPLIPIVGIFIYYGYVFPYLTATNANIHRFLVDEKYGNEGGFALEPQY